MAKEIAEGAAMAGASMGPALAGAPGLRKALHRSGYSPDRIRTRLGIVGENVNPHYDDIPALASQLTDDDDLDNLLRLFFLGISIPITAAEPALKPLSIQAGIDGQLIHIDDTMVKPSIKISLYDDLLFASDFPSAQPQADEVMAISLSSALLHSVTIRRPVVSVYDLGTGCGVQALAALRHARAVVASDVNQRALSFTGFNTELNALTDAGDLDVRLGSLFEPVKGEVFDLVVCNPPFAISPDHTVQFRDSGLPADEFCATLVRGAPEYLNAGGLATILVGWGQRGDEHWSARVREWLPKTDFDSWLIRFHSSDPEDYAAEWNRPLLDDPELYESTVRRWLDYYASLTFRTINFGVVYVRHRTVAGPDANWTRVDNVPMQVPKNASAFLEQLFSATDFVRGFSHTDDFLTHRFLLDDAERVALSLPSDVDAYPVEWITLRPTAPLLFPMQLDAMTAQCLPYFDGERTVSEVISHAAGNGKFPASKLKATILSSIGSLLETGILKRSAKD